MASRNLTQRLAVALCSEVQAVTFFSCVASRTELPEPIKVSLIMAMSDKRMGREVANSVDTGASLSQKTVRQLAGMLADKKAALELQDLLENTAFDVEPSVGPAAPAQPPVQEPEQDPEQDPEQV